MTSARKRIEDYLLERVGEVVTAEQLRKVARISEWARRVRELRDEYGWDIQTNNDSDSLRPGEYMLRSAPSAKYSFPRSMSQKLRAQILERNGYTCQMCGAGAGDLVDGRKVRLHIGHITDRSHGGGDDSGNLRVQCSACNQGAKNASVEPPRWVWLLSQLRRARVSDQKKALRWLKEKLGDDARG